MKKSCSNGNVLKVGTGGKKKKEKEKEEKEDRFSKLPDEVIHCVLSFVDAVTAVQTSVLSKRWKNVWTSLPVLNFDGSSFYHPIFFESFMDDFMSNRDDSTSVYAINLECRDDLEDGSIVDSVIDHVTSTPLISDNIRCLDILAKCPAATLHELSVCRFLTTLTLAQIAVEITTFDFDSLENLYLLGCRFECGKDEQLDLFADCVNLKSLFLHDCQHYGSICTYKIFAPNLEELSMKRFRVDEVFDSDCEFELFTPKLQYFTYYDSDLYDFSIEEDLCFLEELEIVLTHCESPDDTLSLGLMELFEEMGKAKFVTLSVDIIQILHMFSHLLKGRSPPFSEAESFRLKVERPSSSFVMPSIVRDYLFGASR